MLQHVKEELEYRLHVCSVTGGVHIEHLYCKTFHETQMPLNFLFKFIGINLVLVNIKPVEFHLIQLGSFCNIYMSNDVKFFERLYIQYNQVLAKPSSDYLDLFLEIPRYCYPIAIFLWSFSFYVVV